MPAPRPPLRCGIIGTGGIAHAHAHALTELRRRTVSRGRDRPGPRRGVHRPLSGPRRVRRRRDHAEARAARPRAHLHAAGNPCAAGDRGHAGGGPGAGREADRAEPGRDGRARRSRVRDRGAGADGLPAPVRSGRGPAAATGRLGGARAGRSWRPARRSGTATTPTSTSPGGDAGRSKAAGPTMGHGIHQFDLLLSILGPWTEVTAMAARLSRPTNTEDVSMAVARFDNGAMATVVNSVVSPRETSRLRFDFEYATVELEHLYGYRAADWRFTAAPGHEDLAGLWIGGDDARCRERPPSADRGCPRRDRGRDRAGRLARRGAPDAGVRRRHLRLRVPGPPRRGRRDRPAPTRSTAAWTAAPFHGRRSRRPSHEPPRHPPRHRQRGHRQRRRDRAVPLRLPARLPATGVAQAVPAPDPHPRREPGEPVPALGPRVAQGHRPLAAARGGGELLGRPHLRPRAVLRAAGEQRHPVAPAVHPHGAGRRGRRTGPRTGLEHPGRSARGSPSAAR